MSVYAETVEDQSPVSATASGRIQLFAVASNSEPMLIKRTRCSNEEEIRVALEEAKLTLGLRHQRVSRSLGVQRNTEPGGVVSVLLGIEPMVGDFLAEFNARIKRGRHFSETELSKILRNLVSGLAYLQSLGIAHKDVQLQNVYIDPSGEVKLCNFSSAERVNASGTYKPSGTLPYLSPKLRSIVTKGEWAQNSVVHDAVKSDVFALGVMMAGLTAMELPGLDMECTEQQLKEILHNVLGSMKGSEKWRSLLSRMLSINENDRPDFLQLAQELRIFEDDEDCQPLPLPTETNEAVTVTSSCGFRPVRLNSSQSEEVPCQVVLRSMPRRTYDLVFVVEGSSFPVLRKEIMNHFISQLASGDRVSIVDFGGERKCPLTACAEAGKAALKICTESLQSNGTSQGESGIHTAFEILRQRRIVNTEAAVVILADGRGDALPQIPRGSQIFNTCKVAVHCFALGSDELASERQLGMLNGEGKCYSVSKWNFRTAVEDAFPDFRPAATNVQVKIFGVVKPMVLCAIKTGTQEKLSSDCIPCFHEQEVICEIKPQPKTLLNPCSETVLTISVSYTDRLGTHVSKLFTQEIKFASFCEVRMYTNTAVMAAWCEERGRQYVHRARELAKSGRVVDARKTLDAGFQGLQQCGFASARILEEWKMEKQQLLRT